MLVVATNVSSEMPRSSAACLTLMRRSLQLRRQLEPRYDGAGIIGLIVSTPAQSPRLVTSMSKDGFRKVDLGNSACRVAELDEVDLPRLGAGVRPPRVSWRQALVITRRLGSSCPRHLWRRCGSTNFSTSCGIIPAVSRSWISGSRRINSTRSCLVRVRVVFCSGIAFASGCSAAAHSPRAGDERLNAKYFDGREQPRWMRPPPSRGRLQWVSDGLPREPGRANGGSVRRRPPRRGSLRLITASGQKFRIKSRPGCRIPSSR